jgi:KUP system potassium uptake protein
MVMTTLILFVVMRRLWGWSVPVATAVTGFFLLIDLAFFASNLVKFVDGGWFPLLVAVAVVTLITTWRTGRRVLAERLREQSMITFPELRQHIEMLPPTRVPGTAVFMSGHPEWVPAAVRRILRVMNVLHEHVVFFTVITERVPRIEPARRLEVHPLGLGFYRVIARYGFKEEPHVPWAVRQCRSHGLAVDPNALFYILSPETLIPSPRPGMAMWRDALFAFLARNAARPTGFYRLPPARVLEVTGQIEL